jgi:hypothetical protein
MMLPTVQNAIKCAKPVREQGSAVLATLMLSSLLIPELVSVNLGTSPMPTLLTARYAMVLVLPVTPLERLCAEPATPMQK